MIHRTVALTAHLLATAVLACCFGGCSARIGCPPRFPDPAFEGTWTGSDLELAMGLEELSDCPDRLVAHGFNGGPTAVWSLFSFAGEVRQVGRAEGTAAVWIESDEGFLSASFDLEFRRNGNNLSFDLDYTTGDGIRHLESYVLQKQP